MDATVLAPARCFTHDLFVEGATLVQDATTMAVDLAGFTSLTDRLSAWGSHGTERLSQVLRGYFESVTDLVVGAGGDVVAFGGDSLSILFDGPPRTTLRAALEAADRVQQITTATEAVRVPGGELGLGVRLGVARGPVATAVARSGDRLLPVHVGPGLDLAHAAQEVATTGSVAVDGSVEPWRAAAGRPGPVRPGPIRPGPLRSGPVRSGPRPTENATATTRSDVDGLLPAALLERLHRGRALEGNHRTVTVAFVRYPPVDPDDLRPFLHRVATLAGLVLASGGEVVQVSGGDKGVLAMVVLGAPVAHSDDPARAAHAMVELRRHEPQVAVGIATGPVFAAVLGSTTRLFPTHTGLAVNVAARLAQHAEAGQIMADDRTWEEAAQRLRTAGRPRRLAVKGCDAPVLVHPVAGRRRARSRPAADALPLLVGRQPELARVEQLLDGAAAGRGGVLALHGPAGIGKSRVASEALERARTRGFVPIRVDVADHPRGRASGVWRDLLGGLLGIRGGSSRSVWLGALAGTLPDMPDLAAILGPILGLETGAPPRPLDPDTRQLAPQLAQTAVGRLLTHGCRHRPVLVVVEHADRLDEVSVEILRELGAAADRCAAGLVLTWGSEEGPAGATPPTGMVSLAPLDPDETGLLAEEAWRRAGGGTPPSWLAGVVVPHAGGNPLVTQSSVHALLGRWEPGEPPPTVVVEGRVAGLVASQVDRLPADAHELLTVLAVAQRPCGPQLLAGLLPTARGAAAVRLLAIRLTTERMVTRTDDGAEERYRVSHDLVRRVVYDATSHAERERLHRALVDRLVAVDADPVEVAEHVEPLADPVLGRRWFPEAVRAARDGWDSNGALRWLERLRPLVRGAELERVELEVLEVLLVAGRANEVLKRFDLSATDEPSGSARSVASERGDPGLVARRLLVLAEASYSCGQLHRAREAASEVMRLVDGTDEPRYQRAGELLVLARCHQGELEVALAAGRELVDRAVRGVDATARATASAAVGVALVLSGEPEAATARFRDALVAATAAHDVIRQVHVLSDLAGCAYLEGRYETCVELMTQARRTADAIGYRRHLALSLGNEAQLRASVGDPYATACTAASVRRSLDLGDLSLASDALQTWLGATPSLASDTGLWRRLVEIDRRLGRSLEAAAEQAELAVALARAGQHEAARRAALEAVGDDGGLGPDPVRRRAALARLVADARGATAAGPATREQVLLGLERLAREPGLDARESAEIALERWRVARTPATRTQAVRSVREAYAAEPSAVTRSWFRLLREPAPAAPDRLPPPVGITRGRTARRDLEEAFADVEAAVAAAGASRETACRD